MPLLQNVRDNGGTLPLATKKKRLIFENYLVGGRSQSQSAVNQK